MDKSTEEFIFKYKYYLTQDIVQMFIGTREQLSKEFKKNKGCYTILSSTPLKTENKNAAIA